MKASTVAFLKALPLAPILDRVRDWHTLRQMTQRATFSQHDEDRFVLEYFDNRPGFYIDVGANHPFRASNTYLLYLNGWRGLTIEPLPYLSQKHKRYRPDDLHFNGGAGSREGVMPFYELTPAVVSTFDAELAAEWVRQRKAVQTSCRDIPVTTLASLCKRLGVHREVEFLTVDCEGRDLDVLQGIDWEVTKPRLITIETAHEQDGGEIGRFLTQIGYKFLTVKGYNSFFERIAS
jgi:FkbM family methyltransferase